MKIIIFLILILIDVLFCDNMALNCSESCQLIETTNQTNIINCNIDIMSQIDLSCQTSQTTEIHIIPKNRKIVLNKALDIDNENVNVANLFVVYRRFIGIDLSSNAFEYKADINVVVYNSKFVFYSLSEPLTDLQCNESYLSHRKYPNHP